jgi:Zn-dependent peptidase ImmA (M78 family)
MLFREHGGELSSSDRNAIAEFIYLCRSQAHLERDLGINSNTSSFRFAPKGRYFKGQGQECAKELRKHIGLGHKEVVRDIFGTIRKMSFKVFRRRLENSRISGLYINHPEAGGCILVNLAEGQSRQRFSAAHELAHALMDHKPSTMSMVAEWDTNDLIELRANTFASHFLVPPEFLRSMDQAIWRSPIALSEQASNLRVSVPALLSALLDAKILSKEDREQLRNSVARPPDAPDPELEGNLTSTEINRKQKLLDLGLSKSYVDLCFDAYGRGLISRGLLSEMLLTDQAGTNEVAFLFSRSIIRE